VDGGLDVPVTELTVTTAAPAKRIPSALADVATLAVPATAIVKIFPSATVATETLPRP
jgi:hypothetical protein